MRLTHHRSKPLKCSTTLQMWIMLLLIATVASTTAKEHWLCPQSNCLESQEGCFLDNVARKWQPCAAMCFPPLVGFRELICHGIGCQDFVASCNKTYEATSTTNLTVGKGDDSSWKNDQNTPKDKVTTKPVNTSPTSAAPMVKVYRRILGMYNGKQVTSFTLTNSNNYKVELLNLGARVNKLITPKGVDIVLGFATDNINASSIDVIAGSKFGAANGRICSKIFTPFTFNNQPVSITGDANIEGAMNGLYKVNYDSEIIGNGIRFTQIVDSSVDGLPGSVRVNVTYSLDAANNLIVRMTATSTDGTASLVDMCNSLRFNLAGGTEAVSNTHKVRAASDSRLLPTGQEASLGSLYNLVDLTKVSDMQARLNDATGNSEIDVVYTVPGATGWRYIAELATLSDTITVKMFTNQPYLRLYVDDSIEAVQGKASAPYGRLYGISLLAHNMPESTKNATTQKRIRLEGSSTYISETIYKIDEK